MSPSVLVTPGRAAAAVLCDAVLVVGCSTILWLNGGALVTSGPISGMLFCGLVATLLLVTRRFVLHPHHGPRSRQDLRCEQAVIAVHLTLFVAGVVAWFTTHYYYLGWLLCFAAIASAVGELLALLADITQARNRVPGARVMLRRTSLEVQRIVAVLGSIVVLILTSSVHDWNVQIISPLTILVASAIGASVVVGFVAERRPG